MSSAALVLSRRSLKNNWKLDEGMPRLPGPQSGRCTFVCFVFGVAAVDINCVLRTEQGRACGTYRSMTAMHASHIMNNRRNVSVVNFSG